MGVNQQENDEYWMRQALQQAQKAADSDEVPVGAVLVDQSGECLASGHNQPISAVDPTAHAEIVVLREAAKRMNNYRLPDTTLYITLEPCTMCVGALVQARVARIVFAASEPKAGAIVSALRLFETGRFNHQPEIDSGVMEAESSSLLANFFQQKRQLKKKGI
ncbi:MAG: tRNA adenosine(34) deaminase TadA [Gammaproteobacteria bacterium]|nr:MAG: tRNA adenosine(34) deaminase TadA [Gammaproteobacteria bacterium]